MSRNEKFLAARRRNAHRREGKTFIERLGRDVNGRLIEATLLDVGRSLEFERLVWRDASAHIASGEVIRRESLSADVVARLWRSLARTGGHRWAVFFLSTAKDFTFMVRWDILGVIDVRKLIEFDGNAVAVTGQDAADGVALDYYEDIDGRWKYGVDLWGSCRSLAEALSPHANS